MTFPYADCYTRNGERFDAIRKRPAHINVIAYVDGVEHNAAFTP